MRDTQQRRAILQQLRNTKTHPTALELFELVRRVVPHISLGTVYRNLERLAASGQVRKLHTSGQTRFDGDTAAHDHVRCVLCGRVTDAPPAEHRLQPPAAPELEGFNILGYQLEWLGICPRCAARQQAGSQSESP